jgi:hypothetical protein
MPSTKSKVQSKKSPKFTDPGPSGRMHKYKGSGTQMSGVSSQEGGGGGGKFASGGGSGKMHTKTPSKNVTPA